MLKHFLYSSTLEESHNLHLWVPTPEDAEKKFKDCGKSGKHGGSSGNMTWSFNTVNISLDSMSDGMKSEDFLQKSGDPVDQPAVHLRAPVKQRNREADHRNSEER